MVLLRSACKRVSGSILRGRHLWRERLGLHPPPKRIHGDQLYCYVWRGLHRGVLGHRVGVQHGAEATVLEIRHRRFFRKDVRTRPWVEHAMRTLIVDHPHSERLNCCARVFVALLLNGPLSWALVSLCALRLASACCHNRWMDLVNVLARHLACADAYLRVALSMSATAGCDIVRRHPRCGFMWVVCGGGPITLCQGPRNPVFLVCVCYSACVGSVVTFEPVAILKSLWCRNDALRSQRVRLSPVPLCPSHLNVACFDFRVRRTTWHEESLEFDVLRAQLLW